MATTDEQLDAIAESVSDGVKSAEADGQKVERLPLKDRIEAAKFLAAQQSGRRRKTVRLIRCLPPGAA
jgi:hypothetical protein